MADFEISELQDFFARDDAELLADLIRDGETADIDSRD